MTQTSTNRPLAGFTRLTKETGGAGPSGFIIQDTGGYDYYIWVDTAGKLRIGDATTVEAAGFNWLTGGAAVGDQAD